MDSSAAEGLGPLRCLAKWESFFDEVYSFEKNHSLLILEPFA